MVLGGKRATVGGQIPEHHAAFIAEAFERSGVYLAPFSDEQLDRGFWYLSFNNCCEFMLSLIDQSVPPTLRLRALRSFVPLFEQVMAARCSPHLSHRDVRGANPLNSACYMWWDILVQHVHWLCSEQIAPRTDGNGLNDRKRTAQQMSDGITVECNLEERAPILQQLYNLSAQPPAARTDRTPGRSKISNRWRFADVNLVERNSCSTCGGRRLTKRPC